MKKKLTLGEDIRRSLSYCLEAFMLIGIGQLVGAILNYVLLDILVSIIKPELIGNPCLETFKQYFDFVGIWIVFITYFSTRKMEKGIIDVLSTKLRGNNILCFACGLLLGFVMNFTCGLLAMKNGDFTIGFVGFKPLQTLLIFIVVMIQSGAEELLCRGLLYKKLTRRFGEGIKPIIISSLLFAFLHIFNSGLTLVAFINLILAGTIPAMIMYYFDSIWMCIAEHTAWNFTQNILLGLPNSGIRVPFSIFALNSNVVKDSFFYNVGFGIEGSVMATIVHLVVIALMFFVMNKRRKPEYDVWQGITEAEVDRIEQEKTDRKTLKQIKKYTEKDYKKKLKKDPGYTYRKLLDYEVLKEEKAKKRLYPSIVITIVMTFVIFKFILKGIDPRQMWATLTGEIIAFLFVIPMSKELTNKRVELLKEYLGEKINEQENPTE